MVKVFLICFVISHRMEWFELLTPVVDKFRWFSRGLQHYNSKSKWEFVKTQLVPVLEEFYCRLHISGLFCCQWHPHSCLWLTLFQPVWSRRFSGSAVTSGSSGKCRTLLQHTDLSLIHTVILNVYTDQMRTSIATKIGTSSYKYRHHLLPITKWAFLFPFLEFYLVYYNPHIKDLCCRSSTSVSFRTLKAVMLYCYFLPSYH